jgi:hypothetical protein
MTRAIKRNNATAPPQAKAVEEAPLITEQEVWSVLEFAKSMGQFYGSGYLTPDLVSQRMRDVSLNTTEATQAKLDDAMKSPKQSEDLLRAFSQDFEIRSMPYRRLLLYLGNMLAFDVTYTAKNAKAKDYTTPAFEKDLGTVENFLEEFDYRKEFSIVVREMLRNDAYFCAPRETAEGMILQELPADYCKITGRWDKGFLFSFNMYYFLLPGVDIDMYPPFFAKKYNEIWNKGNTGQTYNPALPPEARGNSSWIYWVDVPVDVGWVFKFSPELATRLPFFTPLFNDLVLQGTMRNLQRNINMSTAARMILGKVPMLNKEAKTTVKDSVAVTPELLGKFMALVKSAVGDAVKTAAAPLDELQQIAFPSENAVYDSYLRTALASSGVNSNLIFSSNIKPNSVESRLSLNVDEQLMLSIYPQFNEFTNYWVERMTRKFKFKFEFEGTNFYTDRADRLDAAMTLFAQGIVLPQKIASARGIKPATFRRMMEEAKATGFMDLLTPPAVGKLAGDKGGRPKMKDSNLSDSGVQTRDDALNIGRGGKST